MDEKRIQELLVHYERRKNTPNCVRCGRKFRKYDKKHIFTKDGVFVSGPVCSGCEMDALEEAYLGKA